MHYRHRKRTTSEDEEGNPGSLLVSSNGNSSLNSVKSHHHHYHRGGGSSFYYLGFVVFLLALCLLILIGFSIFSIFHVALRSRPAWLYGTPVLRDDIATCFADDPNPPPPPPPPRVLWEWHNYTTFASANEEPDDNRPIRLLMAQYSGFGEYAQFLNWISPVHQEYAKQHGYDYVILQGTLLDFVGIQPDCMSNLRATFDKIPLLEMAHSLKHKYDYVLVLDTDAMIVDHYQWEELLPSQQMLAAQRVMRYDLSNTWDVNAGVTLWNLHHADFEELVKRWKQLSLFGTDVVDGGKNPPSEQELKQHLETILTKNDDQYFLQTALLNTYSWWNRPVVAVLDEFNYYSGTLVKHFKRDKRSWSTNGLEQRLDRVKEAIREICNSKRKGSPFCRRQERNEPPDTDYTKRKQPDVTTWL